MTTTFKWMALGAVLGFFAATGISCGPAKCTPSNCAFGCCDATGACQSGASDSQCGGAGRTCQACVLGQTCQLGICVSSGSGGGFGGGSQGGGSGGGSVGGGGGTTGGGGGTIGGGGGTTGGGGGGTTGGGGGGAQGGGLGGGTGGGTTGGGTGCTGLASIYSTFMAGRTVCTNGSQSLNAAPSLASQCTSSCSGGNDPVGISGLATCLSSAPTCTTGNENAALNGFSVCASDVFPGLSSGCQATLASLAGVPTGGGGGTTGGGGGTTGGGGGTTGGGGGATGPCATPTNCTFVSWAGTGDRAGYSNGANFELTSGETLSSATEPFDVIGAEVIWKIGTTPTNVIIPGSGNFANEGTYNTCRFCSTMAETCTATSCTGRRFLARAGTMTVSSATRAATGSFAVTLANVCYEEWNLSTDTAVAGGACVLVQSASINASF